MKNIDFEFSVGFALEQANFTPQETRAVRDSLMGMFDEGGEPKEGSTFYDFNDALKKIARKELKSNAPEAIDHARKLVVGSPERLLLIRNLQPVQSLKPTDITFNDIITSIKLEFLYADNPKLEGAVHYGPLGQHIHWSGVKSRIKTKKVLGLPLGISFRNAVFNVQKEIEDLRDKFEKIALSGLPEKLERVANEDVLNLSLAYLRKRRLWPTENSGPVEGFREETWSALQTAVRKGTRGHPGGNSITRIIRACMIDQARKHVDTTGELPDRSSGLLTDHDEITWEMIDNAYIKSSGLGKSSIDRIFIEEGMKNGEALLSKEFILEHSIRHLIRCGVWPNEKDDQVWGLKGETWEAWNKALEIGYRGLEGGSSLPQLIQAFVVQKAREHYFMNRELPTQKSGEIKDYPELTWGMIDTAYQRKTGKANASLRKVFIGVGLEDGETALNKNLILDCMLLHLSKEKGVPTSHSGLVDGFNDEYWERWDVALRLGHRDLDEGSSLKMLFSEWLNAQINIYKAQHKGRLPSRKSGLVTADPRITWKIVDDALQKRGGNHKSSLERYYKESGFIKGGTDLSVPFIIGHIVEHVKDRPHSFPNASSGDVKGAPGETWNAWQKSLIDGERGLESGQSLARVARQFIINEACTYKEIQTQAPDRLSGQVGTWKGLSWQVVDDALKANVTHPASLETIMIESGLKEGSTEINRDVIFEKAMEHLARNKEFPSKTSGRVFGMEHLSWSALNKALVRIGKEDGGTNSIPLLIEEQLGYLAATQPKENRTYLTDVTPVDRLEHLGLVWGEVLSAVSVKAKYSSTYKNIQKQLLKFFPNPKDMTQQTTPVPC